MAWAVRRWWNRSPVFLVGLGLTLVMFAACAHAPADPGTEASLVQFSVDAPAASNVILVLLPSRDLGKEGRFYEAAKLTNGLWSAKLPLEPGEYRYFFMVDDRVQLVAKGARVEKDDFGGVTGVLQVRRTSDGALIVY